MNEVLTIHEVASILKKHYRTVLAFLTEDAVPSPGKLRGVKLGKREWSVRQEWLDEFLNVGTKSGTTTTIPETSTNVRRHHKSGAKSRKTRVNIEETPWYERHA